MKKLLPCSQIELGSVADFQIKEEKTMEETPKMVALTDSELQMLCTVAWNQAENLRNAAKCVAFDETKQLLNEELKAFIDLWVKLSTVKVGDS